MGSPTIFSGSKTKLLTAEGLQLQNGVLIDNDGVKNYISNGHAEIDLTGWKTNGEGVATPVFGYSLPDAVTVLSRNTTAPLAGKADFVWTKTGSVSRIGESFAYYFTIQNSHKFKILRGSFSYQIKSGTYNDDMSVFVYDVDNGALIYCTPQVIKNSTIPEQFNFEFQTTSSANYRFIVHTTTASTQNYTIAFDDFKIGPYEKVFTPPIFDTVVGTCSFTATTTAPSKGTIAVDRFAWSRVGDKLIGQIDYVHTTAGTAGSGQYLLNLPNGIVFDSTKTFFDSNNGQTIGECSLSQQADGVANISHVGVAYAYSSTQIGFKILSQAAGTNTFSKWNDTNGANFSATNLKLSANIVLCVANWSGQSYYADGDNRVLASLVTGTPAVSTIANPVIFPTITKEDGSMYSVSTGKWTILVSGWYELKAAFRTTINHQFNVYVDNSINRMFGVSTGTTGLLTGIWNGYLNAGQVIDIRDVDGTSTPAAAGYAFLSKITGPTQIAASEKIIVDYHVATDVAVSANNPILYNVRNIDSHSAFNATNGRFTAPRSDTYSVRCTVRSTAITTILLYKNGTSFRTLHVIRSGGDTAGFGINIFLQIGEYIQIVPDTSTTIRGVNGSAQDSVLCITSGV